MHDASFTGQEERIQRALNQARKNELHERFGAVFDEPDAEIPAEVESQWLDSVEALETQFRSAGEVMVREYVGRPQFRPIESIPVARIPHEVELILEFLHDRHVNVEFLAEVSDADAYRFLTGELMDQRIENIRLEGLSTCFIYEHYHPNDRYDATEVVKDFLWRLFGHRAEGLAEHFARSGMRDASGRSVTSAVMKRTVENWVTSLALFTTHIARVRSCLLEGNEAVVRVEVRWAGLAAGTFDERSAAGEAEFRLERCAAGDYEILQLSVPGFGTADV